MSVTKNLQINSSKEKFSLMILSLLMGTMLLVPAENVFAQDSHHRQVRHRSQTRHHVRQPVRHHGMRGGHFRHAGTRHHFNRGFHHRRHHGGFIFIDPHIGFRIDLSHHRYNRVIYQPQRDYYFDEFNQRVYPVYIPNSDGTFTVVLIKRFGTGYIGPQKEHYTGFPTVEQLTVTYGRK